MRTVDIRLKQDDNQIAAIDLGGNFGSPTDAGREAFIHSDGDAGQLTQRLAELKGEIEGIGFGVGDEDVHWGVTSFQMPETSGKSDYSVE